MNFIANESAQKLRGGFYTDGDIASFLARWVMQGKPKSLLEPSCGDGAFLAAAAEADTGSLRLLSGCELDSAEAAKAKQRLHGQTKKRVEIHDGDFLRWFLFRSPDAPRFDAVLGNPPFIRYQYLPEEQQLLAEKVFARFGLPFTRHTNAWVPFVVASLSLLAPGGRLAMVIPSEIFHIPHAQSLRRFLAAQCSRVLVFDPEELWFDDALQGVVLLLAEKKQQPADKSRGVAVQPVEDRAILTENPAQYFDGGDYINGDSIQGKWMPVFLGQRERALLKGLRSAKGIAPFAKIASVDVGIVTGANKFFLVPDAVVREHGMERWSHPMFGRSEHVAGLIYDEANHEANREAGLPTNFLWFEGEEMHRYPARVQNYLRSGEKEGLPGRYKCSVRTPWFKVPSVYSSPVAMLKRAHHFPRLVLNRVGAYSTDTAYRIQPLAGSAESLVYSFFNSLTCLCAELEGRHYGGGVLELVPSEIERLLLPKFNATARQVRELDERFRAADVPSELLPVQDAKILTSVGLTKADAALLHSAWSRLRHRRQRVPSGQD